MQYVLMTYLSQDAWTSLSPTEQKQRHAAYMAYHEALTQAGILKGNIGLAPSSSATTVRVVDGKTQVLDGPYADTREQLGGHFIIDVPDLDAAISWAARCPAAGHGIVEVRPAWGAG